jgi:hypothetical protein
MDVLEIYNAGPIHHMRLAFAPEMNILTDRGGRGTGKTTILNCAAAAATGCWPFEHQSSLRSRTKVIAESGGSIYMFGPNQRAIAADPPNRGDGRSSLPTGARALGSLRRVQMSAPAHSLVLLDGDILGVMDHCQLQQAVQLLAASPAQKLVVVPEALVGHLGGLPCRLFKLEIRKEMTHCACKDF